MPDLIHVLCVKNSTDRLSFRPVPLRALALYFYANINSKSF
jgi:hypothetical protein